MATANTGRFTGRAGIYEQFRPGYAEGLLDYLHEAAGLGEGSLVADIGSGTGIFSRQLLARGGVITIPNLTQCYLGRV